jgi:hypothetical protein
MECINARIDISEKQATFGTRHITKTNKAKHIGCPSVEIIANTFYNCHHELVNYYEIYISQIHVFLLTLIFLSTDNSFSDLNDD